MGKRTIGNSKYPITTKRTHTGIYEVIYRGRTFEVRTLNPADETGYKKVMWRLVETFKSKDEEWWEDYNTKEEALLGLQKFIDKDLNK